jgi:hypothetical protein
MDPRVQAVLINPDVTVQQFEAAINAVAVDMRGGTRDENIRVMCNQFYAVEIFHTIPSAPDERFVFFHGPLPLIVLACLTARDVGILEYILTHCTIQGLLRNVIRHKILDEYISWEDYIHALIETDGKVHMVEPRTLHRYALYLYDHYTYRTILRCINLLYYKVRTDTNSVEKCDELVGMLVEFLQRFRKVDKSISQAEHEEDKTAKVNFILKQYDPKWYTVSKYLKILALDGALTVAYNLLYANIPGETELREDFLDALHGDMTRNKRSEIREMLKDNTLDNTRRILLQQEVDERKRLDTELKDTEVILPTFMFHQRLNSPSSVIPSPLPSPSSPPSSVIPFMTIIVDAVSDAGESVERVYVVIIRTVRVLLGLCVLFALIAVGVVIRRRLTGKHTKGQHVRKKNS